VAAGSSVSRQPWPRAKVLTLTVPVFMVHDKQKDNELLQLRLQVVDSYKQDL